MSAVSLFRRGFPVVALLVGINLAACQHATTVDANFDPSTFFARIVLTEHAITLSTTAPTNTVQLHATAILGDDMTISPVIHFLASDSTIVVDSLGHVTARFPTTSPSSVRVCITYNSVTRCDVAKFTVTNGTSLIPLERITIGLQPGAEAGVPIIVRDPISDGQVAGTLPLTSTAVDVNGHAQPNVLIAFLSSDSTIAIVDTTGLVTAVRPGIVTVRASASVYGHTFTDSLRVVIGATQFFANIADSVPGPTGTTLRWGLDTVRISVGGVVVWTNITPVATSIQFTDTVGIESASLLPASGYPATGRGNIPTFGGPSAPDLNADFVAWLVAVQPARTFTKVGVYPYTSTSNNTHGVVIVCALTDPCYNE